MKIVPLNKISEVSKSATVGVGGTAAGELHGQRAGPGGFEGSGHRHQRDIGIPQLP